VDTVPPRSTVREITAQREETSDGRQFYRVLAAAIWTLLILVLCWMPRDLVRQVEDESSWFEIPHLDKIVHWAIFAIFSILWLRVRQFRRPVGWVILSGFVLAVVTEIVQGLSVIGRDMSFADMVTDCIGVVVGVAVAPFVEPVARAIESRLSRPTAGPTIEVTATAANGDRR
jgi:VanZ family protein